MGNFRKSKISTSALKTLDYHESEQNYLSCDISFWEIALLVGKEKFKLNTTAMQSLLIKDYI